jgi:hypothetical protein
MSLSSSSVLHNDVNHRREASQQDVRGVLPVASLRGGTVLHGLEGTCTCICEQVGSPFHQGRNGSRFRQIRLRINLRCLPAPSTTVQGLTLQVILNQGSCDRKLNRNCPFYSTSIDTEYYYEWIMFCRHFSNIYICSRLQSRLRCLKGTGRG